MRTTPTASELAMFGELSLEELYHYAITRIAECEDVWGIGGDEGFTILEKEDKSYITIWPYHQLAEAYCVGEHEGLQPVSISLELFAYNMLNQCQDQGIAIEVFARPGQPGRWIFANELFGILEGMMESGEYYMEG